MILNGLRCHVVDGATAIVPLYASVVHFNLARDPKIYQLQAQSNTDKVLWLEVIVNDILIMDHLKSKIGKLVLKLQSLIWRWAIITCSLT